MRPELVAGFRRRLGAFLLDAALVVVVTAGLALAFKVVGYLIALALNAAYYIGLEGGGRGQTLGKMALRIRVVAADGGPIGHWRAFIRWIGRAVSGLVFSLGYLSMLWDPEQRCWHDKMASDWVVSTSEPSVAPGPAGAGATLLQSPPGMSGLRVYPPRAPVGEGVPLLRVEDLRVEFPSEDGVVHAVDGITYQVHRGRTLGIVGESGSGKTVASLSTLGLTRRQGARISGRILFEGRDLVALPEDQLRAIRGNDIAMIFQDPLSALHPLYRVGSQLVETVLAHRDVSKGRARQRAIDLLGLVGIPDPVRRVDDYPHQFSGGMRQRAMIAMALANEPKLLIADEPTTALDVTVQAQILALLERLQRELSMAIVIITHDLGVVAEMADDIAVMYAGRIVETSSARRLFERPQHPYTWGLLKSIPTLDRSRNEDLVPIPGSPPSLIHPPSGCHFHPRCAFARPEHAQVDPQLEQVPGEPDHHVACLRVPAERERLWAELRVGRAPSEALAAVAPGDGE